MCARPVARRAEPEESVEWEVSCMLGNVGVARRG